MVNEDDLASTSQAKQRKVREVNPVMFFDRGKLPDGQKDFRVKPVKVRPTVPPMDDEGQEPDDQPTAAAQTMEPPAASEPPADPIMEPVAMAPMAPPRPRPPHPSTLPAKD